MPATTIRLLPTNVDLEYRETGDPAGEPVIMLHGVTDSLRAWRPFTDALPAHYRLIVLTQRGHGDSAKPASGYGSHDFAGDLLAVMDQLAIPRAHIIGHSMGGWVAARFAELHADRVLSLVLIGAVTTLIGNTPGEDFAREVAKLQDPVDPAFARAFQESTINTPVPPAFLDMVAGESLKAPAHVWRGAFDALMTEQPPVPDRRIPALLLYGAADAFIGEAQRASVAAAFDAAWLVVYLAVGHAPHWEIPARSAADVKRFLADHSDRSVRGRSSAA